MDWEGNGMEWEGLGWSWNGFMGSGLYSEWIGVNGMNWEGSGVDWEGDWEGVGWVYGDWESMEWIWGDWDERGGTGTEVLLYWEHWERRCTALGLNGLSYWEHWGRRLLLYWEHWEPIATCSHPRCTAVRATSGARADVIKKRHALVSPPPPPYRSPSLPALIGQNDAGRSAAIGRPASQWEGRKYGKKKNGGRDRGGALLASLPARETARRRGARKETATGRARRRRM